jgi:hypothetical protein
LQEQLAQSHAPQQVGFPAVFSVVFFWLVISFSSSLQALHALSRGLTCIAWKPYSVFCE